MIEDNRSKTEKVKLTATSTLWIVYKWLNECPGQDTKLKRQVGAVLYLFLLVASVLFATLMFQGSQSTHVSFKSEGTDGASSFEHRLPDIVACPREVFNPKTEYNVHINPETVAESGISNSDIDRLASIQREGCAIDAVCKNEAMEALCEETRFKNYCHKLHLFFMKDSLYPVFDSEVLRARRDATSANHDHIILNQVSAIAILYGKNQGKWTLQMLWLGIIFSGYNPIQEIVSQEYSSLSAGRSGLVCHFYNTTGNGIREDKEVMLQQQATTRTMWVGKSLCLVQLGSLLYHRRTPFFGCRSFAGNYKYLKDFWNPWPPFRYWFGDLSTSALKEEAFYLSMATNPSYNQTVTRRVTTGIVHYSTITMEDLTKSKKVCLSQPSVRGLEIPCIQYNDRVVSWNYDLTTQARQLSTVWVYGKNKITLTRMPTFTLYTKLTFGAGIFGCLLGMSIAQILEGLVGILKKWLRNRVVWLLLVCRIFTFFVLTVGSITLTVYDVKSYAEGRYSEIFTEKKSNLEIPGWKLCPGTRMDFSFLNVTKFYELNVSLQLYGYLKLAGMLRYPMFNLVSKTDYYKNGTIIKETPSWMLKNSIPKLTSVTRCEKDIALCEDFPETMYLSHFYPNAGVGWKPRAYRASEREELLARMSKESERLESKLGLPKNSPVSDIVAAFLLDPKQIISKCRVRNANIKDCGRFASYEYYGNSEFCLTLNIPQSAVAGEKDYGYEHGLFAELDHSPIFEHSDYYSYYGPRTEQDRRTYLADARCYSGDDQVSPESAAKGYISNMCSYAPSINLRIQLQSFATSHLEYRIHPLLPPTAFIAEISTGFKQTMIEADCVKQTNPVCQHPNEEMAALYMSLSMEKRCGCSFCYGTDEKSKVQVLARSANILGYDTHCCTAEEFHKCYSRVIGNVDWAAKRNIYNEFMKDPEFRLMGNTEETFVLRASKYGRNFSGDTNYVIFQSFLHGAPVRGKSSLEDASVEDVAKLFPSHIRSKFDEASLERLANFTKNCFKQLCKVESLELINIQPQEPTPNKTHISIFYSKPTAHGMELIDNFDVVQLIATLVAGYSVTFGLSLIGLVEIAATLIWTIDSSGSNVFNAAKKHIMKNFSMFTLSFLKKNGTHPAKTDDNDGVIAETSTAAADVRRIHISEDPNFEEIPGKEHKIVGTSSTDTPMKNKVASTNAKCEPEEEVLGAETGNKKITSGNIESMKPRKKIHTNVFLTFSLASLLIILVSIIAIFFLTFINVQWDGKVAEAAYYERPSTIICVESQKNVSKLLKGLTESYCQFDENNVPCDKVFRTFMKNKEKRFCVIQDNTRKKHEANDNRDDLVMTVPDSFPQVVVGAISFNETSSIVKIHPFNVWKNKNAVIAYTMTLSESESSHCLESIPAKTCQHCPNNPELIPFPSICCFATEMYEPAIPQGDTCYQYQFRTQIALRPKDRDQSGRQLVVKLTKRNMLVYGTRVKYSFVFYVSIIGGFFGTLLDLTVMNVCAALLLLGVGLVTTRK